MSKIYVFAIGGTGSRVIKSLTMLLGAGMHLNGFDLVPIFIDPDKANGDLTRTIDLVNSYRNIRSNLSIHNESPNKFFQAKIGVKSDKDPEDFRMALNDVENEKFKDFIGFQSLGLADRAMLSMLFSKKNLEADMEVGFKGNPNIGSVVLNQFKRTQAFADFAGTFEDGDRIFIISSIFGGTGAAGFPLILKNIKERDENVSSWNIIRQAPIGAVTVLPYFGVKQDEDSEIDKSTFISKTKAALEYYRKNVRDLNCLYYIGDNQQKEYENIEGSVNQRNNAHFIEIAAALAVIDFARTESHILKNDEDGKPIMSRYKEYGLKNDVKGITFSDVSGNLKDEFVKCLTQFILFDKFCENHLKDNLDQAWATGTPSIDSAFISQSFYAEYLSTFRRYYREWLEELEDNSRSFAPFNLKVDRNNLFEIVKGIKPRSKFLEKGSNYSRIDHIASKTEKEIGNIPVADKFMAILYGSTDTIVKQKYNF